MQQRLERIWYQGDTGALLLTPLALLYRMLSFLHKRLALAKQVEHAIPVIVVGNISVGGTGKTPLVIDLVQLLQKAGYSPGIITRGYGGQSQQWPVRVHPDSDPIDCGDEPVLMAQRCGVPVMAGSDRNANIDRLMKQATVDIIISDDGLQHYRLKRDIEIVVIDGERGLGNRRCLPAGPLREPPSRLEHCDFVVVNEPKANAALSMQLLTDQICRLNPVEQQSLSQWRGRRVHAVTGIGNPDRFFRMLVSQGLVVTEHAFPDHYIFHPSDIAFNDDIPVVMTEKDAVKCRKFAENHHWFVPVTAKLSEAFHRELLARINTIEFDK
ncbi:MAG: tetraacyldisaccharide 4'-kinase [Proteobacteria bacterium]|nr:MAG: tetraacyldisaccharide 4'-kinase [Pseudomonadota bacterium]